MSQPQLLENMSVGDIVRISGLQNRRDLNDCEAKVCLPERKNGRIGVELLNGNERVWVKPENTTLVVTNNKPPEDELTNLDESPLPAKDLLVDMLRKQNINNDVVFECYHEEHVARRNIHEHPEAIPDSLILIP